MANERVHCNRCQTKTLHDVLCKTVDIEWEELDETAAVEWTITFEMLQCCGCKDVVLRRTSEPNVPWETEVAFFPPAVSRHPPSWRLETTFPDTLRSVLHEVYQSLDSNNRLLPMMGARTLIDMLMVEKVGDVGTFDAKLKQLEGMGVISSRNREVLSAALDVGNAAIHRGHAPDPADVNAVIDIVENLLHAVYVLPGMAQRLRTNTPPRTKKGAKPKVVLP